MQSSINGQVSVGGSGLEDVTVTLSGAADDTDTTGESGLYSFTGLATGSYTVTISAYDAEEYSFASESEDIELGNSDEKTENFSGTSLRTASVTVTVTAEGAGVARAVATLTKTTGKSEPDRTGATDADGMYTFGDLLAGTYQVDISGTDEEIDFGDDGTSWTGPVATDATAEAAFPGTYNRTASIAGTVTIDGAGMADVVVMLSGDEGEKADTTDADGAYSFPMGSAAANTRSRSPIPTRPCTISVEGHRRRSTWHWARRRPTCRSRGRWSSSPASAAW